MAELTAAGLAAKALGLDRHTLYRLASRHLIPHYRAGRALRFDVEELRGWMRQQAQREGGSDELANKK